MPGGGVDLLSQLRVGRARRGAGVGTCSNAETDKEKEGESLDHGRLHLREDSVVFIAR